MFVADGVVYLELQKTGGSHICHLLKQYANGRAEGKHHRVVEALSDTYVIGSIRNPWDWYVSLWAYGVGGKGAIRARTVKRFDLDYYHKMLPKSMGKNWLSPREFFISVGNDLVKPVAKWQHTYHNSADAAGFRQWLKLLLSTKHRFDVGEGYGFSPISQHAGLLSYRYFRLFTVGDNVYTDSRLLTNSGLTEFDERFNITQRIIRTELLEDDFIDALKSAGKELSDADCTAIKNKDEGVTNASNRQSASYYYDDETLELVANRDSYLIQKYGYQAPA